MIVSTLFPIFNRARSSVGCIVSALFAHITGIADRGDGFFLVTDWSPYWRLIFPLITAGYFRSWAGRDIHLHEDNRVSKVWLWLFGEACTFISPRAKGGVMYGFGLGVTFACLEACLIDGRAIFCLSFNFGGESGGKVGFFNCACQFGWAGFGSISWFALGWSGRRFLNIYRQRAPGRMMGVSVFALSVSSWVTSVPCATIMRCAIFDSGSAGLLRLLANILFRERTSPDMTFPI